MLDEQSMPVRNKIPIDKCIEEVQSDKRPPASSTSDAHAGYAFSLRPFSTPRQRVVAARDKVRRSAYLLCQNAG